MTVRERKYLAFYTTGFLFSFQLSVEFADTGGTDTSRSKCSFNFLFTVIGRLASGMRKILEFLFFVLCRASLAFVSSNFSRVVIDI